MSAKFFQFKKNLFIIILLLVIFVLPNNALAENLLTVGSANSNLTGTDSAIFSNIGSISATTTSLIRLQKNGVDLFKVDSTGNVTMGNFLTSISAANVSSGAFGSLSGNGNYSFPGNVGIGTMTPAARLNIYSTSSIEEMFRLSDASGSSAANKYINWYSNNGGTTLTDFARIGAGYGSDYINSFMAFSVADGARVLRERVRINVNGNVGIGITNPGAKLQVEGGNIFVNKQFAQVILGAQGSDGDVHIGSSGMGAPVNGTQDYGFYNAYNAYRADDGNWYHSRTNTVGAYKFSGGYHQGGFTWSYVANQGAAALVWTDLMKLTTAGNVGIGNPSPGYKLDVNGEANFGIGTTTNRLHNVSAPTYGTDAANKNYVDSVIAPAATTTVGLQSGFWTTGAGSSIYNNNTGNVGIGTTNPGQLLELSKQYTSAAPNIVIRNFLGSDAWNTSGAYNGALIFGNNDPDNTEPNKFTSGIKSFSEWGGWGGDLRFFTKHNETSLQERLRINEYGSVGIGTTTPNAALDIFGKAKITNNGLIYNTDSSRWLDMTGAKADSLRVPGNLNSTAGGVLASGYSLSDAATDNLLVNGDFEMTNRFGWNAGTVVAGGLSGNYALQIAGYAELTSNDYIPVDPTKDIFQLEAWIKKTVAGATPGTMYFGYIAYDANKTVITSAPCGTYCYFAASGPVVPVDGVWHKYSATTVGEGTVHPNFPVGTKYVRVLGLINYGSSADSVSLVDHVTLKRLSKGPVIVGNNFSTTNMADQNQYSTLFTTAANNLILSTNGNVGIGTTAPNQKLEVYNGNIRISGNDNNLELLNGGGGTNDLYGGRWRVHNTGSGIYTSFDTKNNNVWTNDRITIPSSSGFVGIGTTTPDAKLNVNGNFHVSGAFSSVVFDKLADVSGSRIVMADSSGALYATSTSVATGLPSPSGISGQTLRSNGTSWIANNLLYNNGTNVGIGTTTPSAKLEVNGDVKGNNFIGNLYNFDVRTNNPLPQDVNNSFTSWFSTQGTNYAPSGVGHASGFTVAGYSGLRNRWQMAGDATATPNDFNKWYLRTGSGSTWGVWRQVITDDGAGSVGIGTTAPGYKLDVAGEANFGGNQIHGVAAPTQGTDAVNRNYVDSNFIASTSLSTNAFVQGGNSFGAKAILGTNDNQALGLETNGTEKMTILANGNVGIRTTAPDSSLSVKSAGNAVTNIYGVIATLDYGAIQVSNVGGLTNPSNRPLVLQPNAGNVGIGTTTPNRRLDLGGGTNGRIYGIDTATNAVFTDSEVVPKKWIVDNFAPATAKTYEYNFGGYYHANTPEYIGTILTYGNGSSGTFSFEFSAQGEINMTAGVVNVSNQGGSAVPYVRVISSDRSNAQILAKRRSDPAVIDFYYTSPQTIAYTPRFKVYNTSSYQSSAPTTPASWDFTFNLNTLYARNIIADGNVGIGTTTPDAKLNVNGNFHVSGAFSSVVFDKLADVSGSRIVMADSSGALYATSTSVATGLPSPSGISGQTLRSNGTSWIANNLLYNNGANIGIGTAAPSQKLDVQGNIAIANNMIGGGKNYGNSGNSASAYLQLYDNSTGRTTLNNQVYAIDFQTATTSRLFITNGGNVGIGTTNPYDKLDVEGKVGARSFSFQHQTNPFSASSERFNLSYSNPGITNGLSFVDSAGSLRMWIGHSTIGNNNIVLNPALGNVGIGTTTPQVTLDVNGLIKMRASNITTTSDVINKGYLDSALIPKLTAMNVSSVDVNALGDNFLFYGGSTGGWSNRGPSGHNGGAILHIPTHPGGYYSDLWFDTANNRVYTRATNAAAIGGWDQLITASSIGASSGWIVDGTTIYNSNSGNVGIGTTNPGAKLDVKGDALTSYIKFAGSGTGDIKIGTTGNAGEYGAIWLNQASPSTANYAFLGGGGITVFNAPSGQDMGFTIGNAIPAKMTLRSDGNVGIGTTTPGATLAIGNSLGLTSTGLIDGPLDDRYLDFSGAFTNSLMVPNNIITTAGKVGIGTSNPTGKLDILSDTTSALGSVNMRSNGYNNAFAGTQLNWKNVYDTNLAWITGANPSGGSTYLALGVYSAGEMMRITSAGSVGIGTSAPNAAYKLDVAGKINTSGGDAGGFCLSGDCIDSWGDVVGTFNSSTPLTIGNLTVSNIVMDQTGGFGNILNVRKLTVGTIDPLYRIDGTNYSSFAAAIVGGVKEEYLGRVKISQVKGNEYEYRLDFSKLSAPDELWVWRQTVDFSPENVEVNLTPYGAFARIYYIIEDEAIIFRADKPVTVSYRLSGKRVDWQNWPTKAKDQQEKPSFIINKGKVIK